jgi:integrase
VSPQRRGKGSGTLFKRKDGYWVAGLDLPTLDGKRRQKRVVAKSRNDALRKLKELQKKIDAGYVPSTRSVKVAPYLDEWLQSVHKKRAKPSTFPDDVRVVKLHIKPYIGAKRLEQLTPQDVRWMLEQIESSRNRQMSHGLLRRALQTAMNDGIVARNVADAVDKPKHKYATHAAFTPDVTLKILKAAEPMGEVWATRWAAGFMTGLRESELLGLEWDRVNLDDSLLDVSWQLQELTKSHGCGAPVDGRYPCGRVKYSFCPQARWDFPNDFEYRECERSLVWTRPKTQRSDRGVPIIAPLQILLERLASADGFNPHNLVFHHSDGTPITQSQDQKAWKALLETAGVEHTPQHTIRRTAATLLRAAQVDEQTRMELFGHAGADVQRLYAGSTWDLQKAAMEKLTAAYGFTQLES